MIGLWMFVLAAVLIGMLVIGILALIEEEKKENFEMGSDKGPQIALICLAILGLIALAANWYASRGQ